MLIVQEEKLAGDGSVATLSRFLLHFQVKHVVKVLQDCIIVGTFHSGLLMGQGITTFLVEEVHVSDGLGRAATCLAVSLRRR